MASTDPRALDDAPLGPLPRPAFYAHRGASLELPENTLPAFERALALGAHVLESDAHVTRDGHPVLSHDPTGRRAAGVSAVIAECALAEVQRWDAGRGFTDATGARTHAGRGFTVPTLAQALEAFPRARFNVDLKLDSAEAAARVVAVVRAARATERVLLTSFHHRAVAAVHALGYEGPRGLSRREVLAALALPKAALRLGARVPSGLAGGFEGRRAQIPFALGPLRLDTAAVLARFHALGVAVDYWTVNDPALARRLVALGADGVMTDDPAALAPVFAASPRA